MSNELKEEKGTTKRMNNKNKKRKEGDNGVINGVRVK